jgi:hypothetical protein
MTRRTSLLAAVVLAAMLAPAVAPAQTPVNRAQGLNPDAGVNVWIPAGTIRIIGWDRDSLVVEGSVGKGDRLFFGGGRAGVKLGMDEPTPGVAPQPVRLTLHVPRGAKLNVRTASASMEISDVSGWFNTVSGDVRVSGTVADIQAEAIDGSIYLTATTPRARARTGSGTVSIGGRVDDLVASTVSGPLTVTAAGVQRARLESVTGAISITAGIDRAASIDVDNHSGSVELHVPRTVAADFDLTSVAGTITNLFDGHAPSAGRQGRGQQLAFVTDPKGARVVVRTFKGPITLRTP